jgi:hypothetical protein
MTWNIKTRMLTTTLTLSMALLLLAGGADARVLVGAEGCTGNNSCGGTHIEEDNDSYNLSANAGDSSCDRGVGYVNFAVAGSAEMCTGGDNSCEGCEVPKPDEETLSKFIAVGGDLGDLFGDDVVLFIA